MTNKTKTGAQSTITESENETKTNNTGSNVKSYTYKPRKKSRPYSKNYPLTNASEWSTYRAPFVVMSDIDDYVRKEIKWTPGCAHYTYQFEYGQKPLENLFMPFEMWCRRIKFSEDIGYHYGQEHAKKIVEVIEEAFNRVAREDLREDEHYMSNYRLRCSQTFEEDSPCEEVRV